ncbi:Aspartic proteinase-like protein 2 [Acorus calamus]|uniref:Aspartic proteinase-like protein 2 n=1 Tax=Acorus calamus TaxID=4465 RepID=A0AAV9EMR9_ACOCL|nr:Aspartic proteinase-like protein 2 [Acorus calamus]
MFFDVGSGGSGILTVHHKFGGRKRSSIGDLRAHDGIRHGRMLSAVDLPMGGLGLPSDAGLYYAQIGIGTPSKNYYVQVDTGSDILWVNCIQCRQCPRKSDLGIRLTLYDPKGSTSGTLVSCTDEFCSSTNDGPIPGCSQEVLCQYSVMYGDGSTTNGYFVNDFVQYNQVSGNLQTRSVNASVIFGDPSIYIQRNATLTTYSSGGVVERSVHESTEDSRFTPSKSSLIQEYKCLTQDL